MQSLEPYENRPRSRFLPALVFVASAAFAAAALRFAWHEPIVSAVLLAAFLAFVGGRWLSRRKLQRVLRSGDVRSVLDRWSNTLERIPHPTTMAPLMTATAFAAYGWVDEARAAMAAAARGPAWDAALEHRLFLETLLCTFEGDRDAALERAGRLARLPLPELAAPVRARVLTLRRATSALARAFAHRSLPGDRDLLQQASEASPLVYWAMRYAAAIVAIDEGEPARVGGLLANAPPWPEESMFRAFHGEIAERAGLSSGLGAVGAQSTGTA